MPDQSQCPISLHSPVILPSPQYTLLSVCLPFSQPLNYSLDSYSTQYSFLAINPGNVFFFMSPPSCIIAFPDTPCLMGPFPCIAVVLPCAGHVALLNPPKRLPAGGVLSYHCFNGSLGKMRGSDNAIGH